MKKQEIIQVLESIRKDFKDIEPCDLTKLEKNVSSKIEKLLNQTAYDQAYERMYKSMLEIDLSSEEFNKMLDNWISINAPKYGISFK